jgi:predicted lipoprotein with Yx(FWY)xxD motif
MNITWNRHGPLAVLLAATLGLAACGDDAAPLSAPARSAAPTTVAAAPASATPSTAPASTDAAVKISQTELGDVLADPEGQTLYAFTNDVEAKSTCYGTCAEAWPPVLVDADFVVSPGLDSGIFATTVRDDGSLQLVAGKFPLYLFAADAKPGDITGHGSGDVWFAVDTSGRLFTGAAGEAPAATSAPSTAPPAAAPLVAVSETELGAVLVDGAGMTLYLFTPDEAGTPTCTGGCAQAWPPVLVEGEIVAGEGIDPALLSTVEHPDGGQQLKIGKWPLYRFAGDTAPGDTEGQGSGGKWFVVGADGKAIK